MNITYKIEDDFFSLLSDKLDYFIAIKATGNIVEDVDILTDVIGKRTVEKYFSIGNGGSHIWISDVYEQRVIIIYYN